jgi:hypothetical protein
MGETQQTPQEIIDAYLAEFRRLYGEETDLCYRDGNYHMLDIPYPLREDEIVEAIKNLRKRQVRS